MTSEITTISLNFIFVSVNCYLLRAADGFILIDTGFSMHQRAIDRALEGADCKPGNLKLIVVTHADFDHIGNCAYLRDKYGAGIAMHRGEVAVAERGDMLRSRPGWPRFIRGYSRIVFLCFPLGRSSRFTPDVLLEDGQSLAEYGCDAKILHLPGHSRGSIGVMTEEGDICCGDLLLGGKKPKKNTLVGDKVAMEASIKRLRELGVRTVYPGHGRAFTMDELP